MSFARRQLHLLIAAIQFLTRLPTPALAGFRPDDPVRAARYYPLVGHLVGALSAAVWLLASRAWSPTLAAVLALAAGGLVTGAFHEDGLADTADGLGGGRTPARRLEIMKDSRIGTFGALALLSVSALRLLALARLTPAAGALTLVVVHGAARAAAVVVMRATAYAGAPDEAKGRAAQARVSTGETLAAAVLGFAPLAFLPAAHALLGVLLMLAAAAAVALAGRRWLGGHTGDLLGAVEQSSEAALLLGCASGF